MIFRRFDNFIWITCLVLVVTLGWPSTSIAQKSADTISTVVIDSAPKKLYSELYSDETGNQFMVEIYEEPQEGENLIHFRSFKNGEIIGRKSQALADAHNFTFFIDETEQRIMRQDTEQMLYNVLKKLMEESDQKLKTNLEDLFDQEKMAQTLSEKIKTPDEEIAAMATRISKEIQTPDEQIEAMATRISKEITFDGGTVKNMAERISEQIKTPDEQIKQIYLRRSPCLRSNTIKVCFNIDNRWFSRGKSLIKCTRELTWFVDSNTKTSHRLSHPSKISIRKKPEFIGTRSLSTVDTLNTTFFLIQGMIIINQDNHIDTTLHSSIQLRQMIPDTPVANEAKYGAIRLGTFGTNGRR